MEKENCSVCEQIMFSPLLEEYKEKSATKKIIAILKEHYGYDYDKGIEELEKILKVERSFKKYTKNPEKYKGKCPKEI